ncbi:hypothetical protein QVD17_00242 [Tagetes erecta]|uniref:Uncharacterized protein n=1 Tax=Tagetes erecta TaxID=13708 RepID=A0AAD8L5F4_TARER|nr:hypothetical protein QVD17_00242 [Tagetes erecta]
MSVVSLSQEGMFYGPNRLQLCGAGCYTNNVMASQMSGEISYNGYKLEEFVPQKTSAYISQDDLHIPEMSVRETLDFSARCQGTGIRAGMSNCMRLQAHNKHSAVFFIVSCDNGSEFLVQRL